MQATNRTCPMCNEFRKYKYNLYVLFTYRNRLRGASKMLYTFCIPWKWILKLAKSKCSNFWNMPSASFSCKKMHQLVIFMFCVRQQVVKVKKSGISSTLTSIISTYYVHFSKWVHRRPPLASFDITNLLKDFIHFAKTPELLSKAKNNK